MAQARNHVGCVDFEAALVYFSRVRVGPTHIAGGMFRCVRVRLLMSNQNIRTGPPLISRSSIIPA